MFETSVVQARTKAATRRPLLFSMSIGAHAAAVVGVVTMSLAGVTLPKSAPHQVMIPVFTDLKPMLGDGGQQPKKTPAAAPQQPVKKSAAPAAVVAPQVVPDAVPQVASAQTSTTTATDAGPSNGTTTGTDTGGPGVPWGSKDGVVPDAPPAHDTQPEVKVYQVGVGDVKAPVALVRVNPKYPEMARRAHLNGWVIVECIIDTNGRIRDARALRSSFAAFEQPAIDAIQHWEFRPGTLNGQPVPVIFNVTVNFTLTN